MRSQEVKKSRSQEVTKIITTTLENDENCDQA